MLSRLSESDSWIWDEGNMTRSAAFAPLESMLTTRLLAADSLVVVPMVFEGATTATMTVTVFVDRPQRLEMTVESLDPAVLRTTTRLLASAEVSP